MNKTLLLDDIAHANGEASLIKKAYDESSWEEYEKCSYAFFPGCQLAASDPESVIAAYQELLFDHPDTAVFIQCCGFAAEKAGEPTLAEDIVNDIRNRWAALGSPVVITACSTCCRWFSESLPEIQVTTLYDHFIKHEIPCSEDEIKAIRFLGSDTADVLENVFVDIADNGSGSEIALNFQKELNAGIMQERSDNRIALKEQLLELFWSE